VRDEGQAERSIYRTVSSGGSFGANPMEQHIGLGKSARILDLEIWWPTSDTRQHFGNVGANQFIEVKEFGKDFTPLKRTAVRLGGAGKIPGAAGRKVAAQAGGQTSLTTKGTKVHEGNLVSFMVS
jgi:hypothetical protein